MKRFEGKVAVVTGGASGIGRALGEALVRARARVVLADVNAEGVEEAAGALGCEAAVVDVRDAAAVEALVDRAVRTHGRIDLMFNNAGIALGGEMTDLSAEDWDRILAVNLHGVLHGVRAAYPRMVAQGSGHIVNTASLSGLVPAPGLVAYATTKHAVVGLSTSLRPEAAAHGVGVTVVCPGFIDTPILKSEFRGSASQRRAYDALVARMGLMKVEDLAADVLRGVRRNEAVVVTPRSARLLWRSWRLSPRHVLAVLERTARRHAPRVTAP